MASDDKIEDTIKAIAARHGIAVSRDDPILVLQTINDRLMKESQAAQQEILDRFQSELEVIAHRWGDDARNKAERTLTAALTASRDAMQQGAAKAVEAVQREIAGQLAAPIREAKRVAMMNIIAAGMTVFAAGLALWTILLGRPG